jgi:PAS domain S-box-containing protein
MSLHSLRAQLLLWFSGLTLFGVFVSVAYLGYGAVQALRSGELNLLQSAGASAADLLSSNLRERELEIDLLARSALFSKGDLAGSDMRSHLAMRVEAHDEYAWIGVADVNGKVLSATNDMLVGQSVAQRPWFKAGLNSPYTGDIHDAVMLAGLFPESSVTEPMRFVDVVSPIRAEDGELRGVLGAHIHWRWVTRTVKEVLDRSAISKYTRLLIADKDGDVLYPFDLVGKLAFPKETKISSAGLTQWEDGNSYLTTVVKVPPTRADLGWQIVLLQPEATALQPIRRLYFNLLLFTLVFLLVLAYVAARFAKHVGQPVEKLLTAALRIGGGDLSARVMDDHRAPEDISRLGAAFNDMAHSLQQHQSTLEKTVEERTKSLAASEAELRLLAENASDVVYRGNNQGILEWISPSVTALVGWTPAELIGQHFTDWVHEDDVDGVRQTQEAIMRGEAERFELRIRTIDGSYKWVSISARPVLDGNGMVCSRVGGWRDIEDAVLNRQALLNARDNADRANRAKGDFLANMSHEIRTPMNAIIGFGSALADTELRTEQRDHLSKLQYAAKSLLRILNDILDLSKIEAGQMQMESEPFDLKGCLLNVQNLFALQLREKQLHWAVELDSSVPHDLQGDSLRLEQVLINLVGNAVKFTNAGEVSLKVQGLEVTDDHVVLRFEVCDTGMGMGPEQIEQLFQAFSQADTSISRKFGGTGLGLSISKRIVALMQGEITARSELGVGSRFAFSARFDRSGQVQNGNDASMSAVNQETDLQRSALLKAWAQPLQGKDVWIFDAQGTTSPLFEHLQGWCDRLVSVPSLDQLRERLRGADVLPTVLVINLDAAEHQELQELLGEVLQCCKDLFVPNVVLAAAMPSGVNLPEGCMVLGKPLVSEFLMFYLLLSQNPGTLLHWDNETPIDLEHQRVQEMLQELQTFLQTNNLRALSVLSNIEQILGTSLFALPLEVVAKRTRKLQFPEAQQALNFLHTQWSAMMQRVGDIHAN